MTLLIAAALFAAAQPHQDTADLPLDAATKKQVIDVSIKKLQEYYVFPDAAAKMAEAVRRRAEDGEYESVTSSRQFATMLTEHLREVSKDKHLRVRFTSQTIPNRPAAQQPAAEERGQMIRQMGRDNFGFRKAEILDGNIGYLRLDGFYPAEFAGPAAQAAFQFLQNCDALIIDLRWNGGGEPATVALVTSYIVDGRVHLNDIWERRSNATEQYWTSESVPGKKMGKTPVWLLTSQRTFSGGEEFAYNLKNLKRATLVGETTGGGAHPVSGHRINDHFLIGVPFARAVNPITKTNWEGTGVEPHLQAPAAEALPRARREALDHLIAGATGPVRVQLERIRDNPEAAR
ncbi:MAG: S41 family peptidase [Bryobacteraceae bacterium]|nr:S41 family peptidase [Bryobacteraceae bacterium]